MTDLGLLQHVDLVVASLERSLFFYHDPDWLEVEVMRRPPPA